MRLYRSLIFTLVFLLVFFSVLFYYIPADADGRDVYGDRLRSTVVEVEFAIEEGYGDGVTPSTIEETVAVHGPIIKYELWCIFVKGSATMEYVATLDDPSIRQWTISSILLPIGTNLGYYLKMFYEDGFMRPSESAYMFAVTKPPTIENLIRN